MAVLFRPICFLDTVGYLTSYVVVSVQLSPQHPSIELVFENREVACRWYNDFSDKTFDEKVKELDTYHKLLNKIPSDLNQD